jgi:FAD/FMN-containing dehydrogenase
MASPEPLSFRCEVIVPDHSAPLNDGVSRWSDSGLERPALVVIPSSAEDVIDAISYAENNGLRPIPAGGGHGSFVPVDTKTLYLNLKRFDSIVLDKSNEVVQFGGGVLAGALLKKCTDEGFYTTYPNSSAVGMTSFILGGGNVSCDSKNAATVTRCLTLISIR